MQRLPPAFALRLGPGGDMQVEREVGEAVADRQYYRLRGRFVSPFGAGQRSHAAQKPLCRAPNQPDPAVALDPPCKAMAVRTTGPDFRCRELLRRAGRKGCAIGRKRAN